MRTMRCSHLLCYVLSETFPSSSAMGSREKDVTSRGGGVFPVPIDAFCGRKTPKGERWIPSWGNPTLLVDRWVLSMIETDPLYKSAHFPEQMYHQIYVNCWRYSRVLNETFPQAMNPIECLFGFMSCGQYKVDVCSGNS